MITEIKERQLTLDEAPKQGEWIEENIPEDGSGGGNPNLTKISQVTLADVGIDRNDSSLLYDFERDSELKEGETLLIFEDGTIEKLLPPAQNIKAMIKREHLRAELQRLNDGWSGCGCEMCQSLYRIIDLAKYGKRVSRVGDIISIGEDRQKQAKILGDKWVGADQIYIICGQGYATAPDGHTFLMGSEAEIVETLKTGNIPDIATPEQKAEYKRIIELLKELEDGKSVELQRPGAFRSRVIGKAKRGAAHIKPSSFRKKLPGSATKR